MKRVQSPFETAVLWDIKVNPDGSLPIGDDGDFMFAEGLECLVENILWRLRTVLGEWKLAPECGSQVHQLIGHVNSRETGTLLQQLITEAIDGDGYLSGYSYTVDVYPTDNNTVAADIEILIDNEILIVNTVLNLATGGCAVTRIR